MRLAHFQLSVSKGVLEKDHSELVPIAYRWEKDDASKSLLPVTVPEGAALVPLYGIKVTDQPCTNDRCMC